MEPLPSFAPIAILLVQRRARAELTLATLKNYCLLNELRQFESAAELMDFLGSSAARKWRAEGRSYLLLMEAGLLPADRWRWLQQLDARAANGPARLALLADSKEEADAFRADPFLNVPFLIQPVSLESISRLAAPWFSVGLVRGRSRPAGAL